MYNSMRIKSFFLQSKVVFYRNELFPLKNVNKCKYHPRCAPESGGKSVHRAAWYTSFHRSIEEPQGLGPIILSIAFVDKGVYFNYNDPVQRGSILKSITDVIII
jgi:hypothetical protein